MLVEKITDSVNSISVISNVDERMQAQSPSISVSQCKKLY